MNSGNFWVVFRLQAAYRIACGSRFDPWHLLGMTVLPDLLLGNRWTILKGLNR